MSDITGSEHWTTKRTDDGDVRLFLWRKRARDATKGAVLFVHGSSMASQPVFDLKIPGQPDCSVMDWFAQRGYDSWCVDCEGYGRSDKSRPVNADVSCGADDVAAAARYIAKETRQQKLFVYGSSSGALRAGLFAQRHPELVRRLALDAFVWTGKDSPTLAERRRKLAQFRASHRRPIDREFLRSIFTRDGHGENTDPAVIEAFADQVLALDTSVPTGTYIDMSANLPVVDPSQLVVPTLIMRGEWDGIASMTDLLEFFARLPNPEKQFTVMPGIAHSSLRSRNADFVFQVLESFFSRPAPVYTGEH